MIKKHRDTNDTQNDRDKGVVRVQSQSSNQFQQWPSSGLQDETATLYTLSPVLVVQGDEGVRMLEDMTSLQTMCTIFRVCAVFAT